MSDRFNRDVKERELPETWPVLHTLRADEHSRLWTLAITRVDSVLEGMVIGTDGSVMGRFSWPEERYRVLYERRFETVRDGFLYAVKGDEETGLYRVIRYRLEREDGTRFR